MNTNPKIKVLDREGINFLKEQYIQGVRIREIAEGLTLKGYVRKKGGPIWPADISVIAHKIGCKRRFNYYRTGSAKKVKKVETALNETMTDDHTLKLRRILNSDLPVEIKRDLVGLFV